MEKFLPDIYQKSIFSINYDNLKKRGIKCLIFDLDNTIARLDEERPNQKTKDFFEELKDMDFRIIIMSNSNKGRIAPFKEELNVDASAMSKKPFKKKYQKIMNLYNLEEHEIAAIGDQLITDVYGANKMNFTSILVNPISNKDLPITFLNRFLEKKIMKKLGKKGLFEIGKYYE